MHICLSHLRQSMSMGGTERYQNQLATYLCNQGHEVTIVCRSRDESPHPAIRFVVLHDFAIGSGWRRWAFANAVEKHLTQANYDVSMALGRTWGQDLVHIGGGCYQTHLDHNAIQLSADGLRQKSRPKRLTDRVALAIEKRALTTGAYRRVLVNSSMVKQDIMRRHAVPGEAIKIIYHGVDTSFFNPGHRDAGGAQLRQSLGYTQDDVVYLFLASGFHRKGLDLLIDALPAVVERCPRAQPLVVGQDSATRNYQARAERLGVAAQVQFLGRRSDVEACYAAADLYVLPTRYDAFGLSVLEALACGLPVITTTTCGAAELIREGVEGTVVNLDRGLAGLSEALAAWSDPARLRRARPLARQLAEQHDIRSKFEETEALLKSLAEEKRFAGRLG
jgi:UDP-glucose:(heptosyl)LPS alpha-1,3-glucosyltransferase